MHLVVFEDPRWPNFAPLSFSRPVFALATGCSTLLEKQIRHLKPTRLTLWVRPELEDYCRNNVLPDLKIPAAVNTPLDHEPALLSSARVLHLAPGSNLPESSAIVDGDQLRKAFVKSPGLCPADCLNQSKAWLKLLELPRAAEQARAAEYLWDLVHWNEEALVSDAANRLTRRAPLPAGPFHLVSPENISIAPGATIAPGVVLDASKGPVLIDEHAAVNANSVLRGPCYIGAHCIIGPLALIREGVSVGQQCRIGGEVAQSIFTAFSNKAHDGYLGHSFIGEWVNLGAGTTTSNLKNTYGSIRMQIGSRTIETNRKFMGSMIGDHTKTAIGTRLMTGSYIGYCSLLAAGGLPPRYTPSFTFWTDKGAAPYNIEKARDVMKQVFSRRNRAWTDHDESILRYAAQARLAAED
jgi:UDP-N-acetylglucosamine diphosphorylase/glucosamine-1-phosphate N-acetyltransferase